jgi:hypothetical protein
MSKTALLDLLKSPRLPSVETQTVAFVEAARARNRRGIISCWLTWRGFRVYLRYWRNVTIGGVMLGEVLVIADVEVPKRLQQRGWFWRYCQFCCALVERGIVIESVVSDELAEALARRPEFKYLNSSTFYLEKRGWGDWPLSLLPAGSETTDEGDGHGN